MSNQTCAFVFIQANLRGHLFCHQMHSRELNSILAAFKTLGWMIDLLTSKSLSWKLGKKRVGESHHDTSCCVVVARPAIACRARPLAVTQRELFVSRSISLQLASICLRKKKHTRFSLVGCKGDLSLDIVFLGTKKQIQACESRPAMGTKSG